PNDPSDYNRMYVVVADPAGGPTAICCPVQNPGSGVGLTEVPLQRGYTTCISKDCKIVCHEIFTLPKHFFEKKVGHVRPPEQDEIQTALIAVFDLS
ncbi:MAG: type II toxin-antitoxin system PemK/MazF family toxin, partial [Bdellovibrionota bacterium]